jgi:hypothetical protein
MVCQHCDHGQRYCAKDCRELARKTSCKRAKEKYQKSHKGRVNNAERQQRFRQKQKEKNNLVSYQCQKNQKVTDQGSLSNASSDLLIERPCARKNTLIKQKIVVKPICHFCGCLYPPKFRVGFLKTRTTYPYQSKTKTNIGDKSNGD